jgi:hypothetical protein
LDQGGKLVTEWQPILSAVLVVAIVAVLLAPWPPLRRVCAGLMAAVLIASMLFWLLIALETFTYDRIFGFFLIIFPVDMMGLPLLLSAIGLVLHRIRRKRDFARA